jgi:recombination protein U
MAKSKQQQHGDIWERYIRIECGELKKQKRALVRKNWEAPRIPGKKIPREKSKPDFSGCLDTDGMHVAFEAKAVQSTTSFPLSQLEDHQREHLELVAELGGIAFVYVLDGNQQKWIIPIASLELLDRASVPFKNSVLAQCKLEGEIWLDTLERMGLV